MIDDIGVLLVDEMCQVPVSEKYVAEDIFIT